MRREGATSRFSRLTCDAGAEDICAALRGTGAVIVEGALPVERLKTLDRQITPVFAEAKAGRGPFFGRRTRRFSALFRRVPATIDLALHSPILTAVERILKGDADHPGCDRIQINLTQAIAIDPGEPAQILHRDAALFPCRLPVEMMVNVLWVIDPFTEANGATRIVPGSHQWPAHRRADEGDAVAAEAPPGSAILWLGSTWHGGGANRTSRSRRCVVISYSLGWLAQAEKLLLSIPPPIARRLPSRLQELIGYQIHRPNLGWVEGRNPADWLHGRLGDLASVDDNLTPEIEARIGAAIERRHEPAA